jgi:formylglycine-generating enzyme
MSACSPGQVSCLPDGTESACVCTVSQSGCCGLQPQTCDSNGQWKNSGSSCMGACVGGACVPCAPGALQCTGQQPQTCDAAGAWQSSGSPCNASQTCVSGLCTGVCGPGEMTCEGNGVALCQSADADAGGQWGSPAACMNQTCSAGATSDAGAASASCQGVCAPGQTTCLGKSTPQTCATTGQWQPAASCFGTSAPFCIQGACTTTPPSCAPGGAGMTHCGAGSESCCTSLQVTGGAYSRTFTNDGTGPTGQADPATVSDFRLDKYEVTVGRFRQFVNAVLPPDGGAGWLPAAGSGRHTHLNGGQGLANSGSPGTYETGWATTDNGNVAPTNSNLTFPCTYYTWTNGAGSNENLPINCVSWYMSYAFCIWDGGFLPSEAEYEYAAAGGDQQREYPWGATPPTLPAAGLPDPRYAIFATGAVAPVGTATLGAGLWGQIDLTGNVSEWNLDQYAAFVNPCTDCAYLGTGSAVRRGNAYDGIAPELPSSFRFNATARTGSEVIGFRCARTP